MLPLLVTYIAAAANGIYSIIIIIRLAHLIFPLAIFFSVVVFVVYFMQYL